MQGYNQAKHAELVGLAVLARRDYSGVDQAEVGLIIGTDLMDNRGLVIRWQATTPRRLWPGPAAAPMIPPGGMPRPEPRRRRP